jgi:hypothetical protein
MSYIINKTNGSRLSTPNMPNGTLLDGTIDATTGLSLIGRNYPSYGEIQNENFVRLLENFADANPPTISLAALNVLTGTVWYDTVNKRLRVYDGTDWNLVGLPAGTILLWNTSTGAVPTGFHVCDGTNGALNLTANALPGTSYIQKLV